jgi:hypothetical protein
VNRVIVGMLVGLALGAAGTLIVLKYPALREYAGAEKEPEAAEQVETSFLQHEADGRVSVKLDGDTQARMGLQVAPLVTAELAPEVQGYGRVLDPTPLAALVTEAASAQATLQASTQEYERLRALYAQNQNASARALETAEAALKRDQIALASVQSRLLLGWGKAVATQADLAAFVHSLTVPETALVRVDLPLGEPLQAAPTGGRIALVDAPDDALEAQYLGPAPSTDPQFQGRGFLLLAQAERLPPGTAVRAWLTVPHEKQSGVVVPRDAVLRHEGRTFVYLQTREGVFQRTAVVLERPTGDGWFVPVGANDHSSLQPQEKVVVVGAQQLLSEELKGREEGE